jgi:intein/homing endonuclease
VAFAVRGATAVHSIGLRTASRPALRATLRYQGLLGHKRLPRVYLRASLSQRLALLQGLMDTDGTASRRGRCEFMTTNDALFSGVLELVRSLGMKPTWARERPGSRDATSVPAGGSASTHPSTCRSSASRASCAGSTSM